MSPAEGDELDGLDVEYPRFDHGEDLLILVREDSIEFRLDSPGEYLRSEDAVHVEEAR